MYYLFLKNRAKNLRALLCTLHTEVPEEVYLTERFALEREIEMVEQEIEREKTTLPMLMVLYGFIVVMFIMFLWLVIFHQELFSTYQVVKYVSY